MIHLTPRQEEPPRISPQTSYFQKLDSLAYIFVADSMGLASFKFEQLAPKDATFLRQSAFWPFKVIQGHPRSIFWYQSKARMRLTISLVINSNFGPILHRFRDTATYWLKLPIFPTPLSFGALAP